MRTCSVFVICSEQEAKNIRLSEFEFPQMVEINMLGKTDKDGQNDFRFDVRLMLRSHIVVTVGNWFEDEKCNKAVQVARIMDLEVIHHTQYKQYVEAKYN